MSSTKNHKPMIAMTPYNESIFWRCVNKIHDEDSCWEWQKGKTEDGYGRFKISGTEYKTHRIAYLVEYGVDPDNLCVCHKCDNPSCVRPSHLFLGTRQENTDDMISKERDTMVGERSSMAKFTEEQVLEIRALYAEGNIPQRVFAEKYGVTITAIYSLIKGKTWSHLEENPPENNANHIAYGSKHYGAKLNEEIVLRIRDRFSKGGILIKDLANEYNVTPTAMRAVVRNYTWKHLLPKESANL